MNAEVIVYTCTHKRQVVRDGHEWHHVKFGGRQSTLCDGAILRSVAEIKPTTTTVIRPKE